MCKKASACDIMRWKLNKSNDVNKKRLTVGRIFAIIYLTQR